MLANVALAPGGYYTLSSTAIRLRDPPEEIARRLPRYPLVPATLIGCLAIDRRYQGQGWRGFLLLDALHRSTMSEIDSFTVIVDAIVDEAMAFYGMTALRVRPRVALRSRVRSDELVSRSGNGPTYLSACAEATFGSSAADFRVPMHKLPGILNRVARLLL
jgi:hypothetical protein